MTPVLLVALAGGLGSATRFVVDGLVRRVLGSRLPWGTVLINLSGSFLLGLATGLALRGVLATPALTVVGAGFLGGYTTFSAASIETVRLVQQRRWAAAFANGVLQLTAAVALAWGGLALGAG